jgi:hypothetical protein
VPYLVSISEIGFRVHSSHPSIAIDADVESFRALDEHWGVDSSTAFYEGVRVLGTDGTLTSLDRYYASSSRKVFYRTLEVQTADRGSFEALGFEWARDRFQVFLGDQIVKSADAHTIRALSEEYAADANHVYRFGNIVEGLSPSEFGVWGEFSRVGAQCFFTDKEITGAHAATFAGVGGHYARDAQAVYFQGKKVRGAELSSFESSGLSTGKDNTSVYLGLNRTEETMLSGWEQLSVSEIETRSRARQGDAQAMIAISKTLLEEHEVFDAYVWALVALEFVDAKGRRKAKAQIRRSSQAADPHDEVLELHEAAKQRSAEVLKEGVEVPKP